MERETGEHIIESSAENKNTNSCAEGNELKFPGML